MARPPLSVTVITLNEEKNLARALESVGFADEIVVVDSGSTDRTREIAEKFKVRFYTNPWPGYGQQKNFAQAKASHDWVFNLDADEAISKELREEIETKLEKAESQGVRGFQLPRKTFYWNQWIRHGGWYPNLLVRLVDRRHAKWSEPEVHEDLEVDGPVETLNNALLHYSFPNIHSQVLTNLRFAGLGAQELRRKGMKPRLRRLIGKPIGKFAETYILKRGFLDGLPGLIISVNAAYSMFLKYAFLYEEGDSLESSHRR
jgi:glycosyltransferase involved in cell wall biosynthesis